MTGQKRIQCCTELSPWLHKTQGHCRRRRKAGGRKSKVTAGALPLGVQVGWRVSGRIGCGGEFKNLSNGEGEVGGANIRQL